MSPWRVRWTKKKEKPDDELPPEDDLFDTKAEADAEKNKKKAKAKKGDVITQHLCAHAVGELTGWYNCQDDPTAEYETFTKDTDLEGRPA